MRSLTAPSRPLATAFWIAVLTAAYAALISCWYWQYRSGPFAQDDLGLIAFLDDSSRSVLDKVLATDANRLRPVTHVGYLLTFAVSGNVFVGWWALNAFLLALVSAIVGVLVWWMTNRLWLGLGVGALIAVAPFAQYQVVTATGLVEALSLVWLVLIAAGLLVFGRSRAVWGLTVAAVSFALLVFTHERFQLLVVALVAAVALLPNLGRRERAGWAAAFIAPVVLLTAVKAWMLGIPLFIGSGTTTEVGFSWDTFVAFVVSAVAQLFGINWGPPLFNGKPVTELEPWLQGLSFLLAALTVLLLLAPVRERFSAGSAGRLRGPATALGVLLLTALTLLIPITITSRLEQRWLMSLYVLLLGCVAYLACRSLRASTMGHWITVGLLTLFAAAALILDVTYRQAMAPLHFMGNKAGTAALVEQLTPVWQEAPEQSVFVVDASGNPSWSATLNQAMAANTDLGARNVVVIPSMQDLPRQGKASAAFLVSPTTGALGRIDAPTPGSPPLVTEGPFYADGWVGPKVSVASTQPACRRLLVTTQSAPWGNNVATVTSNFGTRKAIRLTQNRMREVIALRGPGSVVTFKFQRAWVPKNINAGEDMRALAARMKVACIS